MTPSLAGATQNKWWATYYWVVPIILKPSSQSYILSQHYDSKHLISIHDNKKFGYLITGNADTHNTRIEISLFQHYLNSYNMSLVSASYCELGFTLLMYVCSYTKDIWCTMCLPLKTFMDQTELKLLIEVLINCCCYRALILLCSAVTNRHMYNMYTTCRPHLVTYIIHSWLLPIINPKQSSYINNLFVQYL